MIPQRHRVVPLAAFPQSLRFLPLSPLENIFRMNKREGHRALLGVLFLDFNVPFAAVFDAERTGEISLIDRDT